MKHKPQKSATQQNYDVFISYRRENGAAEARLIRSALEQHGLRVFLDVTDLGSGHFDDSLLRAIAATPGFVVVLSAEALERCGEEKDWLRREIATAIASQRNIVPVMLPGFAFPAGLPEEIADLQRYQGVEYSHTFFEASVEKALALLGLSSGKKNATAASLTFRELGTFARRHALAFGLATLLVAAAAAGAYAWMARARRTGMLNTINDLKGQFHDAVNALVLPGPGQAASAQKYMDLAESDVNKLMQADPNNGDAIYYSGELKRVGDSALFSPKSCLIASHLKSGAELDPYESDFLQYLDIERKLPASETGGGDSSDLCYSRVSGYCPQRTAWIDHLLANDFYDEAVLSHDSKNERQKLDLALAYAQSAAKLYHDPQGVAGFSQCTPTTDLIQLAQNKLATLPH